jgi:hypothetical protein
MSMLNNIMANKKTITQQHVTTQPGRNKSKTSKHEKTESLLLEFFGQKQASYISTIQGQRLDQKTGIV